MKYKTKLRLYNMGFYGFAYLEHTEIDLKQNSTFLGKYSTITKTLYNV